MFYQNPDAAFRITGVFYVERAAKTSVLSTGRKHTAIAYRLQGKGKFSYGDTAITALPGSVTYIPAGLDYRRSSTPESMIVIHLQGFGQLGQQLQVINHMEQIEPFFRKLLSAWETVDTNGYARSMKLLYSIFEFLQQQNEQHGEMIPAAIDPGVRLLYARYKDPKLRMEELARACFVSQVYFRNLFHRHFGKSPQQVLLELRFRYACELLTSGYYTQKEAAQLAGFSDVKYFRTAFKKHLGCTPSAYIKQERR